MPSGLKTTRARTGKAQKFSALVFFFVFDGPELIVYPPPKEGEPRPDRGARQEYHDNTKTVDSR